MSGENPQTSQIAVQFATLLELGGTQQLSLRAALSCLHDVLTTDFPYERRTNNKPKFAARDLKSDRTVPIRLLCRTRSCRVQGVTDLTNSQ
jgi:hypothetical protein